MAKVYLDEIDAYLSSSTTNTLTVDSTESSNIGEAIQSFVDGSKAQLDGVNWDNYRTKFAAFSQAMQTRMRLASKLATAIEEALRLLKDYLGEDQMLDSSQLEEYKLQRQSCQNSIDTLKGMLNATRQVQYTDANGQTQTRTEPLYDANEIRSQITLAEETLTELDRIIKKIEGLDAVYSQAESILQAAFSEVTTFKSEVESIVPDFTCSYRKA